MQIKYALFFRGHRVKGSLLYKLNILITVQDPFPIIKFEPAAGGIYSVGITQQKTCNFSGYKVSSFLALEGGSRLFISGRQGDSSFVLTP